MGQNKIEGWPTRLTKVDEEQDTIGKENIAGGNTVTAHTEGETNESILDYKNDDLNSSFTEVLNHKKEKKELLVTVNKIKI